eukprot:UN09012
MASHRPTCPQCMNNYGSRNLMTYLPANGSYYCSVCMHGLTTNMKKQNAAYYGNYENQNVAHVSSNKPKYVSSNSAYGHSNYGHSNYGRSNDTNSNPSYSQKKTAQKSRNNQGHQRMSGQTNQNAIDSGDYSKDTIDELIKIKNSDKEKDVLKQRGVQTNLMENHQKPSKFYQHNTKLLRETYKLNNKYGSHTKYIRHQYDAPSSVEPIMD